MPGSDAADPTDVPAADQEPEYTFDGFEIVVSVKVGLTPVPPPGVPAATPAGGAR